MSKIRIHEYAKEIGLSSKEVIDFLESKNIEVKSHMSSIEDDVLKVLDQKYKNQASKNKETNKGQNKGQNKNQNKNQNRGQKQNNGPKKQNKKQDKQNKPIKLYFYFLIEPRQTQFDSFGAVWIKLREDHFKILSYL